MEFLWMTCWQSMISSVIGKDITTLICLHINHFLFSTTLPFSTTASDAVEYRGRLENQQTFHSPQSRVRCRACQPQIQCHREWEMGQLSEIWKWGNYWIFLDNDYISETGWNLDNLFTLPQSLSEAWFWSGPFHCLSLTEYDYEHEWW